MTCHLPYPPISGGRRREFELLRRMTEHCDVHLIAASKTADEDLANAAALREWCTEVEVIPTEAVPAGWEAHPVPHQVLRHRSADMTERVAAHLNQETFDVVHVEGFYLMQHVPPTSVPVLLVEQNVEYELWRQQAVNARNDDERRRALWQYFSTVQEEIAAWKRAACVAALTPEDYRLIRDAVPEAGICMVPDGADHLPAREDIPQSEVGRPLGPLVVFFANFGYSPNVDAARFLVESIMPRIEKRVPNVTLWLVGNAPPPEVENLGRENIFVTGRVDDPAPYLDAADVVVCPLRVGGGIKVKVIEALRREKPVVTTEVGAQGFDATVRRALEVADDPAHFARAVVRLLRDPSARRALSAQARLVLPLLPTWDAAAAALVHAYEAAMAAPEGAARQAETISIVEPVLDRSVAAPLTVPRLERES